MDLTGGKVYADLTFIINIIMDALILWTTAKLTGLKFSNIRILAASLLGGVYAVVFLLFPDSLYYSLPSKILFSGLLIILAFYPQNWSDLKKAFLYFYMINFVVAGAIMGLSSLVIIDQNSSLTVYWLMVGIPLAIWLGLSGHKYLFARIIPSLLNYIVEVRFDSNKCYGKGFLDTGNMLRDPLTNRPVLIAEYSWLKNYLPLDLVKIYESSLNESELLSLAANSSWSGRLRIIPFSSIGRQNGMLLGFRADEIKLEQGNKHICHKNMIVAVYQDKLSQEGNYQLLIPAEVMQVG